MEEKFRKRGIGKALVEEAYKFFRKNKVKQLELTVAPNNKAALDFWEKEEFEPITLRQYKKL